jgi:hypothetical protein
MGLKKQKSMVKQNKKLPSKRCLFFKQSRSAYKNSILSNTFCNLSTFAVDNFLVNNPIDFLNHLRNKKRGACGEVSR